MTNTVDAVFKEGGAEGIGLVGAVSETKKAGYKFENLAGTSEGAIVASLLAVVFRAKELKEGLEKLNCLDFKDESFPDKLGVVGKGLSIGFEYSVC
jgi:NTE family protein